MSYKVFFCLLILLQLSCKENNSNNREKTNLKPETKTEKNIENQKIEDEIFDDCVFVDDYEKLTQEWLKELKIENFIWDKENDYAVVKFDNDSVFVRQGGCYHFSYVVKQKTLNTISFDSTTYWVDKSIKLAEKFNFKHYANSLKNSEYKYRIDSENSAWILIQDIQGFDNLIHNGVELIKDKTGSKITISKYYN